MGFKTLVIDDEKLSRNRILKLLSDYDDIEVLGEVDNGTDAVDSIDSLLPDLVFLDIQMPGLTGFQVLEKIKHHPVIVFITAYDEYAVKAFEVNAVDYLLKPLSRERFSKALEKALFLIGDNDDSEAGRIDSLLDYLHCREQYLERITFKDKYQYVVADVNEIDFFRTEDSLVFLYLNGRKHMIDFTLNSLEEQLDPSLFFQGSS